LKKNARRRADLNTENTRGTEPTRSSPVSLRELCMLVRGVPVFAYLHTGTVRKFSNNGCGGY
jgi:hypothetical protein